MTSGHCFPILSAHCNKKQTNKQTNKQPNNQPTNQPTKQTNKQTKTQQTNKHKTIIHHLLWGRAVVQKWYEGCTHPTLCQKWSQSKFLCLTIQPKKFLPQIRENRMELRFLWSKKKKRKEKKMRCFLFLFLFWIHVYDVTWKLLVLILAGVNRGDQNFYIGATYSIEDPFKKILGLQQPPPR